MKRTFFFLICLMMGLASKAVDRGYTCLGLLCYVNVNLTTDPVNAGMLTYTIPTPPDYDPIYSHAQGPGSPHLTNCLGSTIDLQLRRSHLLLEYDGQNTQFPVDILVKKWSTGWGQYTTDPGYDEYAQCYYQVIIILNNVSSI